MLRGAFWVLIGLSLTPPVWAQAPVAYRLSFGDRVHHLMDVEVTFSDLPEGTLELRMSRTSPGRYALHEFAKNVFDVRVTNASGQPLVVVRPNPHQWNVSNHGGSARVTYRVFGDRIDGTYLSIDSTHAHVNMPAALMWARGLETRPYTVRFEPPAGVSWRVATQLLPGRDAYTFNAPNLHYLMDSPSEFSAAEVRRFTVNDEQRTPVFRVAVHHAGNEADVDAFVRDVQSIVQEARYVFGEYPAFEGNTYTFIADYLPWANGDAMEHRNSTILTSASSIRANRLDLLESVSHEFFHAWNVERIRPKSLEPFNLEDANMSGELWFAEGFTSYYGPLILKRAGLFSASDFAEEMGRVIDAVMRLPGRQFGSAVEMSQLAPFVDAAAAIDPTNFGNTFISYYTWGEAIGLGLDLLLRDRSDGRITLDHYMRALWQRHGRSVPRVQGSVESTYTLGDLKAALAEISGDNAFANEFFANYVEGRDIVDYPRLLGRAGFVVRQVAPGRAYAGPLRMQDGERGVRITASTQFGSPAYAAGLERDDVITSFGGSKVTAADEVNRAISSRKPGDSVQITFERRGQSVSVSLRLVEDPRREVVPAEQAGQTLSEAQQRFRDAWLSSAASRNVF
jgi:predicted metalloprotease with PDZ domain